MTIRRLEHYNIRTTKFDETIRFYVEVLGMYADRPPMAPADFPKSWIFDETGIPAIHLTPVDPGDPEKSYSAISQYRGGPDAEDPPAFRGSGAIDHVAFECTEYEQMMSRLKARKIAYVENKVPQIQLIQVFIKDPNGVGIELNFRQ